MAEISTEYKRGLWIATDGKLTATSKQSEEKAIFSLQRKLKRLEVMKEMIGGKNGV